MPYRVNYTVQRLLQNDAGYKESVASVGAEAMWAGKTRHGWKDDHAICA